MTEKRFLIFDAYYGTAGGNQRYIRMLFENARKGGWQPSLVCPGEGRLTHSVEDAGGPVTIVPQPKRLDRYGGAVLSGGLFDRIASFVSLILYNFRVLPVLREAKPAVVQCHNSRSLLMVALAAKIAGIPTSLFIKAELSNPLLDRLAILLATRVFFISDVLVPSRRKSKYRTLPIGIDFASVDTTISQRDYEGEAEDHKEHLTFAFAGWLVPAKGIHVLIDAFERVTHQISDVRLDIIGDSDDEEYKAELNNVVAWQRLEDRVTFHGWRDDVLDVIDDADVYVLPSFTEGVPRSIVEAMALGKPVIATDVGGVPDLLEQGELGLIVEAGDSTKLADALYAIAEDRDLRRQLSSKGMAAARGRYSFDTHHTRLEELLDDIAQSATKAGEKIGEKVSVQ